MQRLWRSMQRMAKTVKPEWYKRKISSSTQLKRSRVRVFLCIPDERYENHSSWSGLRLGASKLSMSFRGWLTKNQITSRPQVTMSDRALEPKTWLTVMWPFAFPLHDTTTLDCIDRFLHRIEYYHSNYNISLSLPPFSTLFTQCQPFSRCTAHFWAHTFILAPLPHSEPFPHISNFYHVF